MKGRNQKTIVEVQAKKGARYIAASLLPSTNRMMGHLSPGVAAVSFFCAVVSLPACLRETVAFAPALSTTRVSAFLPASNGLSNKNDRQVFHQTPYSTSSSSRTQLSMVIDRLSFECIEAIKLSHDIGHELGLEELPKEILFAGVVAKPERAQKTLDSYSITADEVQQAATKVIKFQPGYVSKTGGDDRDTNEPLPFADETKMILSTAANIATRMETGQANDVVRSEHVLLALMGYNNGRDVQGAPVIEVLREMPSIRQAGRDAFTVTRFCNDLVQALPMTPVDEDGTTTVIEDTTVVIGGGSGNTNTLAGMSMSDDLPLCSY